MKALVIIALVMIQLQIVLLFRENAAQRSEIIDARIRFRSIESNISSLRQWRYDDLKERS